LLQSDGQPYDYRPHDRGCQLVDPKGRVALVKPRDYLSKLPLGAKVTTSVKPSVMKLPAKDTAQSSWPVSVQVSRPSALRTIPRYAESSRQRDRLHSLVHGLPPPTRKNTCTAKNGKHIKTPASSPSSAVPSPAIATEDLHPRPNAQTISDIIKAYIKEEGAFYLCGPYVASA